MFVKLGQILSTRTDLLPADAIRELSRLQDNVRPGAGDAIAALLEEELDRPLAETFLAFDWQPIAAASIGQVYRAQLPDGSPVIVKVKRPGLDEQVEVDLSVLEELGKVIESRTSWGAEYHVRDLVGEFSRPGCAKSSTSGSKPATRTPLPRRARELAHLRAPGLRRAHAHRACW